jgi:soluble lytic murein transglycosylase-like protein
MSVRLSLAALVSAVTLFSAEHVLLKTGFRITAEKVEKRDGSYYLHTAGGVTQVLEEQVDSIERDDYIPPPPAAIKPPAQAAAEVAHKPKPSIAEMVTRAAIANGLPPEIVHSVARAESAYQPNAVSPKGAIGVMQLMPATAASLQADPHDPEQNIEAGARYLRDLLIKYDGDSVKALAAYNAGPGAVDKYHGVPPYRETITYVDRVLRNYTKMVDKNKANASAARP